MRADNGAQLILEDCQRRLDKARRGGNWFSRGGDSLHHGTFHSQIAPYHDRVYYEGRVAWAALVMANPRLYLLGDVDSTGMVVYSFDKQFDAGPQHLVRIAGSVGALKNTMPKDPILVAFAAEVRNDSPREIDRLVPPALTGSRQVRYETIYLQRNRMPGGYLAHTLFPVIISTSQPTQVMLLPCELWADELVEQWEEFARLKPPARETTGGISAGQYEDLGGVVRSTTGTGGSDDAPGQWGRPNPPTAAHAVHQQSQRTCDASPHVRLQELPRANAPAHYAAPDTARYEADRCEADQYGAQNAAAPYAAVAAHQPGFSRQLPQPGAQHPPQPALDPAAEAFTRNPFRLTQAAAAGLRMMQRQQGLDGVKVRIAISSQGYQMDFTQDGPEPAVDFMYTCDGVTLLVDRDSATMLTGVQMDLVHSPQGMGFVFRSVASI